MPSGAILEATQQVTIGGFSAEGGHDLIVFIFFNLGFFCRNGKVSSSTYTCHVELAVCHQGRLKSDQCFSKVSD